jgi:large subunit ribosomal protein L29
MKIIELNNKTKEELQKILLDKAEYLRDLNFKDANRQLKDIREIRETKKIMARIKTILNKQ